MLTRMPGPILRFAQDDARAHCVALALLTLAIVAPPASAQRERPDPAGFKP